MGLGRKLVGWSGLRLTRLPAWECSAVRTVVMHAGAVVFVYAMSCFSRDSTGLVFRACIGNLVVLVCLYSPGVSEVTAADGWLCRMSLLCLSGVFVCRCCADIGGLSLLEWAGAFRVARLYPLARIPQGSPLLLRAALLMSRRALSFGAIVPGLPWSVRVVSFAARNWAESSCVGEEGLPSHPMPPLCFSSLSAECYAFAVHPKLCVVHRPCCCLGSVVSEFRCFYFIGFVIMHRYWRSLACD
eukprot:5640464-Pleurochrysis_carterae.AAC.1